MINVIKIFLPTALSFIIGIFLTPRLTTFMYRHKLWKKNIRTDAGDITNDTFKQIHDGAAERATPRVGGVIIWGAVVCTIAVMWIISRLVPSDLSLKLDFFSKNQTLIPLVTLLLGSAIGIIDDYIQIKGVGSMARDALHYRYAKILAITVVGGIIGWWFYQKLGITTIHIPFSGEWYVGMYFIPFFVLILIATYSTSVIDGLDGLAGGVLAIVFAAYSLIAFTRQEIDVATLCGVVAGAILAFLWFNIPPARFYMGETGIIGLMMLLTVIAFLTNTVFLLPIIALPLAATTLSNILQITAYKYFGKRRIFKIAPLHHHFQAMGWSKEKIVMRYWVVAIVAAIIGVVLSLIS